MVSAACTPDCRGHAVLFQMIQRILHIHCVPQNHGIDDESQSTELIFLAFAVAIAEFTTLAVTNHPCQIMAFFGAIELRKDASSITFIVNQV